MVGGPPHFNVRKFAYWKLRMSAYLDAISPKVWKVTKDGYEPTAAITDLERKANAHAQSKLFEAISEEVFDRVKGLDTAHKIWTELVNIHKDRPKFGSKTIIC